MTAVVIPAGQDRGRVERDSASTQGRGIGEAAVVDTRPPAQSPIQPSIPEGAPDGGLDRVISERDLAVIARDHVTHWGSLAPFLGLTRAQEQEIAMSYPGDYGKQKRECLYVWKEKEGERAMYRSFISAAEEAGNQQLAHSVRDLYSHTTGTVERDSDVVEDEELETLPVPPTDTRTLPVGTNANPSPSIEAMQEQSNGDSMSQRNASSTRNVPVVTQTLGEDNLVEITDQLMDLDQSDVYNLGLVLGLAHRRVVDLRENSRSNQAFLDAVVLHWLQRDDHVKEVSWAALVKALRHQRLGHTGIATSIAEKYGF
ncbi:hypothetical protein GBAR_LOCUS18814 [Geodia barretti]|uniref:Death domain-containing protein n=1 Tax=Geodia barretti TaxID=519541 RepID=A0AA35SNH4_GEOBA|nr:hypothetical protein GBAR_LOCUS18814 [Geodia barretti]